MPVMAECFSFVPLEAEQKKIPIYSVSFVGSSDSRFMREERVRDK